MADGETRLPRRSGWEGPPAVLVGAQTAKRFALSRSWKSRVGVLALTATMGIGLVGLASPAGAAKADPKNVCKGSGWQTAQSGTGDNFKNQGACVSFVARGGIVFSPSGTLTLSCTGRFVHFNMSANGFHPSGTGSLLFTRTVDGDATFVDTAGLHAATTINNVDLNQCAV